MQSKDSNFYKETIFVNNLHITFSTCKKILEHKIQESLLKSERHMHIKLKILACLAHYKNLKIFRRMCPTLSPSELSGGEQMPLGLTRLILSHSETSSSVQCSIREKAKPNRSGNSSPPLLPLPNFFYCCTPSTLE